MIFTDPDIKWTWRLSTHDEFVHVIIEVVEAGSVDRAKQATVELASLFANDRETWWRVEPEADSQIDFATCKTMIKGYARFSFRPVPGTQHFREKSEGCRYLPRSDL
jgi:hypothetical protein